MEVLHDKALVNNVKYMFTFPLHVELVILLKYGMKRFPSISGEIYHDTNIG